MLNTEGHVLGQIGGRTLLLRHGKIYMEGGGQLSRPEKESRSLQNENNRPSFKDESLDLDEEYNSRGVDFRSVLENLKEFKDNPIKIKSGGSQNKFPVFLDTKDDDRMSVSIITPGFKKEDISITFNKETRILGVIGVAAEEGGTLVWGRSFDRKVEIENYSVDEESISARMSDGVLTVSFSKAEEKNIKIVEIK